MFIIRQKLFHLIVILSVIVSLLPVSHGQTNVAGAATGGVYDVENNQPIPSAVVRVRNLETGLARTALTGSDGKYRIINIAPGPYEITATARDFENIPNSNLSVVKRIEVSITSTKEIPFPAIALRKVGTSLTAQSGSSGDGTEATVNRLNATREGSFNRREILALPLPGIRTFDDLAFLLPGVAPPPQAIGSNVGPGVGPGVGTSGQFSVNGMRSRSNNFTIDGSDNNDEDIGVRRQGFTSLVPQALESVQEFQIITLLPEPQYGRTPGAQVNAVSRSGGNDFHGTLYGFFTNRSLKAREVFDLVGGDNNYPITRGSDNSAVIVDGSPLAPQNPVEGENPFSRTQLGFVVGGPIVKDRLLFFGSFERQNINASRESHFAVPTVAERGLTVRGAGLSGDRGISRGGFFGGPTSLLGDAFFSLFPFPNNPVGPYGGNTYTEVLRADAEGTVFSGKLNWQNLKTFGKDSNLTGRYNFTDDDTLLPVTGGAIFSSLEALVRTQNLAVFYDTAINRRLTNQFRASYGRTRLDFNENRNPKLLDSHILPNEKFLLNAIIYRNVTREGARARYSTDDPSVNGQTTEDVIGGPLGQLIVSGYSPVGVDVFNFPQSRVNHIFQYADTLIFSLGKQQVTAGFDIRRVHLNSSLDRNFRPLAVFTGAATGTATGSGIPLESELQGRDFVAVGVPTGFTQTLALAPDSSIALRSWQNHFFIADQIRLRSTFTLTVGATYQLNTVPTDTAGRIEKTFSDPQTMAIGIGEFLAGRTKIFQQDKNNIAPYVSVAWDPFGKGETSVRAGYGIYYDQIPGAVVSQSRSVFPNFFTFNFAGISGLSLQNPGLDFVNPSRVAKGNTLNTFELGSSTAADVIDSFNQALKGRLGLDDTPDFARPDFVLPAADFITPYSQHWGLTVEQVLKKEFVISAAYVGTRGVHLLRFATPNKGPNKILKVTESPSKLGDPIFKGEAFSADADKRGKLGSYTSIESDANSIYHSLQVQVNKRLSRGIQFGTSYTWSHAIDEVSDIFDLAGAPILPQDSLDRAAERASANYDVRNRFTYNLIWDIPGLSRNRFLGGWQLANTGTFQTGQPYSVLYSYDFNQDGNLTDRITPAGTLIGKAGRNLFRAPGLATIDLALNKTFRLSERQNVEFRTEIFNAFNRANFGIPVNQINFGGLGDKPRTGQVFVDTRVPARSLQFALKYNF